MAEKFKPSDVVRHKTSNQLMVVIGYYTNPNIGPGILASIETSKDVDLSIETDLVECEWLLNGKVKRDKFHEDALTLATDG